MDFSMLAAAAEESAAPFLPLWQIVVLAAGSLTLLATLLAVFVVVRLSRTKR
ncbi:hypothetical protein [Krasilnikovia sp. M28-CT-15]|uniref:hypothetical protein n=1 Tax=Krasilnikovia sp. M28-CT-15 TaxID=3373540 RepID=UPI00399C655A